MRHDESAECSITANRTKKITRTSSVKKGGRKKLFIELVIEKFDFFAHKHGFDNFRTR